MKKQLLTKLLLAAAILGGANSSAWADKNYSRVFKYTFDDPSTYTTGWTIEGTAMQHEIDHDNFILFKQSGKNANYTQTLDFSTSVAGVTDYMFSFEFGYSSLGTAQDSDDDDRTILTVLDSGGAELFHLTAENDGANIHILNGSTDLGNYKTFSRYTDPDDSYIYQFTITGDSENGVVLAVKNKKTGTAVTLSNATLNASFKLAAKLVNRLQKTSNASYHSRSVYNDVYFGEAVTGAFAEAPTFAFTSVAGNDRNYTISNSNGEGTIYYTTSPVAEAPAKGNAAYSTATEGSKTITVSSTGFYHAYVVLADGTTSSDITSQYITVGAVQLNAPTITRSGNTVTITSSQADVLGSPTGTIYYKYNTDDYSVYSSAITVAADATIYAYVGATNYTNSATVSRAVAVLPTTVMRQTENNDAVTGITYTTGAYSTTTKTASERTYAQYLLDGEAWGTNIYFQTSSGWNFRSKNTWYVSSSNNNTAWILFPDMKAGDIITMQISVAATGTVNATYSEKYTNGTYFAYVVDADGDVELGFQRKDSKNHNYLTNIAAYTSYESVTINTTAQYATYCSTYALDFSATGAKVYTAKADNNTKTVALTEVTSGKVPANTGVMLYKAGGGSITPAIIALADALENNELVGITQATTVAYGTNPYNYILEWDSTNSKVVFNKAVAGGGATLAANKAYLSTSVTAPARSMALVFDNDITGINEVSGSKLQVSGAEYYDLQGRRVDQPTSGMYIVNGKKVVIK